MASDREVDLAVVGLEVVVVAVVVPAVAVDLLGIFVSVGIDFFSFVTVGSGLTVDCCVAVVLLLLLLSLTPNIYSIVFGILNISSLLVL